MPSARLRRHTLIDTPGLASLSTDVSLRTMAFLEAEADRAAQTDAVIYLLRHMHASDVRFLESFHGDDLASGTPVNAVGVLSRADEIGGCRLDAMDAAARVAARYAADDRLRRLCPVVVPVAGPARRGRRDPARGRVPDAGRGRRRCRWPRWSSCCSPPTGSPARRPSGGRRCAGWGCSAYGCRCG